MSAAAFGEGGRTETSKAEGDTGEGGIEGGKDLGGRSSVMAFREPEATFIIRPRARLEISLEGLAPLHMCHLRRRFGDPV